MSIKPRSKFFSNNFFCRNEHHQKFQSPNREPVAQCRCQLLGRPVASVNLLNPKKKGDPRLQPWLQQQSAQVAAAVQLARLCSHLQLQSSECSQFLLLQPRIHSGSRRCLRLRSRPTRCTLCKFYSRCCGNCDNEQKHGLQCIDAGCVVLVTKVW